MTTTRTPFRSSQSNTLFDGRASGNQGQSAAVARDGSLLMAGGLNASLNVTGAAVNLKTGAGRLVSVMVTTLSAAVTSFYDATSGTAAATLMFNIPANAPVGTIYNLNIPFNTALRVAPGASGVLTVVWN